MLGKDQPGILQLLEIPDEKAQKALKGVMMELEDCAFPLLAGMEAHSDPKTAFKDTDYALLVVSMPRKAGMERSELLSINGKIFIGQGQALDKVASRNVKVLVVGNPANTDAYIAMKSAPILPRKHFTAMLPPGLGRVVSPLIPKGTVDTTIYDHASVPGRAQLPLDPVATRTGLIAEPRECGGLLSARARHA